MREPVATPIVQQADPLVRRRALVVIVALATIGALTLVAVERWIAEVQQSAAPSTTLTALSMALWYLALLAAVPVAALGAYAWRVAGRVRRARCFPPPGLGVLRDTVVLEGNAALGRATTLRVMAVLLLICAVVLVIIVRLLVAGLLPAAG